MRMLRAVIKGDIVAPRFMLLVLRLSIGWLIFEAGWDKLTQYPRWTAEGYLTHASSGPLAGFFEKFAGVAAVDWMVIIGEILIGLALLLGIAVRWAALWGAAMMLLFYLTQLPPEHGWVSDRLIYVIALAVLAAARAGTFLGLDAWLERAEGRYPALRYVLG